ncbi:MAG: hypothetical protein JNJ95_10440 [Dechloromonas sp.]|nr:hypothetical protein [Dechloromonas sp.]
MIEPKAEGATGISAKTIVALLAVAVIPLAVIYHSGSDSVATREAWRADCLASEKAKIEVTGLVRERQGGFHLEVGRSWHYLGKACDGKNFRGCLESNPGKGLLAANVGKSASANLCDGEVLSYRVAGGTFYK